MKAVSKRMQKPLLLLSCRGQSTCLVVSFLILLPRCLVKQLWTAPWLLTEFFIEIHCWDLCFNCLVMAGNLLHCKWFCGCFFPACFQSYRLCKNSQNLDLPWSVCSHPVSAGKYESQRADDWKCNRNIFQETKEEERSRAASTALLKGYALGTHLRGPSSCQEHHRLQSPASKWIIFWPAVAPQSPLNTSRTQNI